MDQEFEEEKEAVFTIWVWRKTREDERTTSFLKFMWLWCSHVGYDTDILNIINLYCCGSKEKKQCG
jgi:hypothetical protein